MYLSENDFLSFCFILINNTSLYLWKNNKGYNDPYRFSFRNNLNGVFVKKRINLILVDRWKFLNI